MSTGKWERSPVRDPFPADFTMPEGTTHKWEYFFYKKTALHGWFTYRDGEWIWANPDEDIIRKHFKPV